MCVVRVYVYIFYLLINGYGNEDLKHLSNNFND